MGVSPESQVNINEKNKNGWTPLTWAAINGHVEVAQLLIQATVDIFARDAAWLQELLLWLGATGRPRPRV